MYKFSKTVGVLKPIDNNWMSNEIYIPIFDMKLVFFFLEENFEKNQLKDDIENTITNFLLNKAEDKNIYTRFMYKEFKDWIDDEDFTKESDIWDFIYPSSITIDIEFDRDFNVTENYILSVTCTVGDDYEAIGLNYRNGIDFIGVLSGWGNFTKFKNKQVKK